MKLKLPSDEKERARNELRRELVTLAILLIGILGMLYFFGSDQPFASGIVAGFFFRWGFDRLRS